MRFIISPAKKMRVDTDSLPVFQLPVFLDKTNQLLEHLKSLSLSQCQSIWKCNDEIAQQNYQRIQKMDLHKALTPALLAYEGIQYQYMAPEVFTQEQLEYVQEHLRILSGFYGILRPMDGICPYRLEMQSKLPDTSYKTLYQFWGDRLADTLSKETDCLVNLASKEYSRCIQPYWPKEKRWIQISFGELKDGKVVEKATMSKMARGAMIRYAAEQNCAAPESLQGFCQFDFSFDPVRSTELHYIFIR